MHSVVVFFTLLAGSVWLGGFITIMVVTRVARRRLDPPVQVDFFRALGRSYGVVSSLALVVALAGGGILLAGREWDRLALIAVGLVAALVISTGVGVVQARGMTRVRQAAVHEPADYALAARVRRGSVRAAALRAGIGVLSIGLLVVAVALAA